MKLAESFRNKRIMLILAHIGALITISCWATSFISTKVLMEDGGFTPIEVYTYRFALAWLILMIPTCKKIMSDSWRDELAFFLSGICCGSVYFILENYALLNTTTGNVSLLASISPLFTTLLMALVFKMKIFKGDIVGSLLAFGGVACVIFSHGDSLELHPIGDVLALAAALSWAVYTLAIRRLMPIYNGLFITRKLFFYGVITSIPLLLVQKEPSHLALLFDFAEPKYFLNLLFLVLMCSITAYLIWNETMKTLGSVTANNYIYLQPPITMVVAYFVLGEKIYTLGYVGCALIIGGLILADKWKK